MHNYLWWMPIRMWLNENATSIAHCYSVSADYKCVHCEKLFSIICSERIVFLQLAISVVNLLFIIYLFYFDFSAFCGWTTGNLLFCPQLVSGQTSCVRMRVLKVRLQPLLSLGKVKYWQLNTSNSRKVFWPHSRVE